MDGKRAEHSLRRLSEQGTQASREPHSQGATLTSGAQIQTEVACAEAQMSSVCTGEVLTA